MTDMVEKSLYFDALAEWCAINREIGRLTYQMNSLKNLRSVVKYRFVLENLEMVAKPSAIEENKWLKKPREEKWIYFIECKEKHPLMKTFINSMEGNPPDKIVEVVQSILNFCETAIEGFLFGLGIKTIDFESEEIEKAMNCLKDLDLKLM